MQVIRHGKKAKPQPAMTDAEVLHGYHDLEEQLGLRKSNNLLQDLEIPELNPVPKTQKEVDNEA